MCQKKNPQKINGNGRYSVTNAEKCHSKYKFIAGNKVLVKSEVFKVELDPPDISC